MPKHTLAQATIGVLVMPGLLIAGYPDVPRSHWAAPAVDKVAQAGVMTSRSDGRFHGDSNATRYEVAQAVANAMADLNNRLIAEGRSPEDLVPYVERINLYVADEIDHLKQSQKELRATVNELLERMERREAGSAPLPPPCPPAAHPHTSPVPMTELRQHTELSTEQRVHPVEGAATVHETTAKQITQLKTHVAEGKVSPVEGAAPIVKTDAQKAEEKALHESFDKRIQSLPSDEASYQQSPSTAKDEAEAAKADKEDSIAADESKPDIDSASEKVSKKSKKETKEDPDDQHVSIKGAKKVKKNKKGETELAAKAPRSAPSHLGGIDGMDSAHGAVVVPEGAPAPFAGDEQAPSSPEYPGTTETAKELKKAIIEAKAEKDKDKSSSTSRKAKKSSKKKAKHEDDEDAPKTAKKEKKKEKKSEDTQMASAQTSKSPTAEEVLGGPETADDKDGPSDEQLSNWKADAGTTTAAPTTAAAPTTPAPAAAPVVAPATGGMPDIMPPATPSQPVAAPTLTASASTASGTTAAGRSAKAAEILAAIRANHPAKQ